MERVITENGIRLNGRESFELDKLATNLRRTGWNICSPIFARLIEN